MKLLEGIQLHELILIVLGFILGLVLIFVFLFTALRGKINLKLLWGFSAPLVMIGYPSFQSVQFNNNVDRIDLLIDRVNRNPNDTLAQVELMNNLKELPASRCKTSSDAMTTIANAQAALGLYESAATTISKAEAINANSDKVQESKQDINVKWERQKNFEEKVRSIDRNIKALERNPNNVVARDSIALQLQDLNAPVRLKSAEVVTVAKGAAIVGEQQQAVQITDNVLKANPEDKEAHELKQAIVNKVIERKFNVQSSKNKTPSAPAKTKKESLESTKPQPVKSPAAVLPDSLALKLLVVPKSAKALQIWNKEQ